MCRKRYSNNYSQQYKNPERHLNASSLHLNNAGISVLVRDFQAFLKNLDWQEYEDV